MKFLGELRVEARRENLRIISHFIHGVAQRLMLTDKVLFDIELAVEEAATNIINHAYSAGFQGDILIHAAQNDDVMHISLTDWGRPLNPDDVKPFDIHAPVETRIKGGMGLHFIHTLMDEIERSTAPEPGLPNTLKLSKHIERMRPGLRPPSAVQELNAMRTISEVMTSNIELDELLSLILNKLVATVHAERGTLYLIDEEKGELWSKVLLEDCGTLSEIRLKIGEGIAGYVAATGETVNIPDAYADPRFNRSFDQSSGFRTRSMIATPMFNPQQKVIGVVQLLNKQDGPFTWRDERLLAAMTSQAAISIENARLYEQEIQQRLINQELKTAYAIQASFLPDKIRQYEGWDIEAIWQPVRNVAGDFYDFSDLDDGRLAIVIADVSGKGIPAALFMALSVTVLRFGMSLNLPPDEVTRRSNELIIADQRSRMFATTFVAYLDLQTGEMQFASGGHNPALLYRAQTQTCEYLDASGVAIGIFKEAEYSLQTAQLSYGDVLMLYTDGITEVINDDEEEFGEDRLEALLKAHADRPAQEVSDIVLQEIAAFSQNRDPFDDATLVVVKRIRQ